MLKKLTVTTERTALNLYSQKPTYLRRARNTKALSSKLTTATVQDSSSILEDVLGAKVFPRYFMCCFVDFCFQTVCHLLFSCCFVLCKLDRTKKDTLKHKRPKEGHQDQKEAPTRFVCVVLIVVMLYSRVHDGPMFLQHLFFLARILHF